MIYRSYTILDITSTEELQEYLSDEDSISARDLKILRWYSSLGGQEVVYAIDNRFEGSIRRENDLY